MAFAVRGVFMPRPRLRSSCATSLLPCSASSVFVAVVKYLRIFAFADGVATMLSQSRLGFEFLFVRTSMRSPLSRWYVSGTTDPFTFAPTQWLPTSVCTAYAKSSGVESRLRLMTSPLGVNTKISSSNRSTLRLLRYSVASPISSSVAQSRLRRIQLICESMSLSELDMAPSELPAFLYSQWAAMPYSARSCISNVRIWISIGRASAPMTVVCSDW